MAVLTVTEIFRSIQGEGAHAGLPCAFVRLTGCPLRCLWCDTTYAYEGGQEMPLEQVAARALSLGPGLVQVTGGEPLAQPAAPELLARLCDAGARVLLETSGALSIAAVDERVHLVMDLKAPGSGMSERMHWQNLELLKPGDEVKLVLAGRGDYDWARQVMAEHDLPRRCRVLLSPAWGLLAPAELAEWMLGDGLDARLNLPLHKIIWGERRGV